MLWIRSWGIESTSLECRILFLRDDVLVAKPFEDIEKRRVRFLIIEEAQLPALGHVIHALDLSPEVGIGVPPGGEILHALFAESVLCGDVFPQRRSEAHFEFQWRRSGSGPYRLQAKVVCKLWP